MNFFDPLQMSITIYFKKQIIGLIIAQIICEKLIHN